MKSYDQQMPVPTFEELLAEVMSDGQFGHREHVHLTWLAVRRCDLPAAITLVSEGIARTASGAGMPQKYHATMTRAWTELIGFHAREHEPVTDAHQTKDADGDFAAFAARNPALLDQHLLSRFYRPETLASPRARNGWVAPDRAPFPWPG